MDKRVKKGPPLKAFNGNSQREKALPAIIKEKWGKTDNKGKELKS